MTRTIHPITAVLRRDGNRPELVSFWAVTEAEGPEWLTAAESAITTARVTGSVGATEERVYTDRPDSRATVTRLEMFVNFAALEDGRASIDVRLATAHGAPSAEETTWVQNTSPEWESQWTLAGWPAIATLADALDEKLETARANVTARKEAARDPFRNPADSIGRLRASAVKADRNTPVLRTTIQPIGGTGRRWRIERHREIGSPVILEAAYEGNRRYIVVQVSGVVERAYTRLRTDSYQTARAKQQHYPGSVIIDTREQAFAAGPFGENTTTLDRLYRIVKQ